MGVVENIYSQFYTLSLTEQNTWRPGMNIAHLYSQQTLIYSSFLIMSSEKIPDVLSCPPKLRFA